jgi:hypothetical protein
MSTAPAYRVRLILLLLLFKAVYLGLLCGAVRVWPGFDQDKAEEITQRWFSPGDPGWAPPGVRGLGKHFTTWDAEHYLFLSEKGYRKGAPSCAFYPLWPLAIRCFSFFTRGNRILAGVLLANIFSLAAWVLFYELAARRVGKATASWALVLLMVFPGALFFQFVYSESLCFLLLMLLWRGLEDERYGLAWVAALLLPLTRAVGLFSMLPIAWYWLMRSGWGWLDRLPGLREERERLKGAPAKGDGVQLRRVGWPGLALVLAPGLGFTLYLVLMRTWTGNALEGLQAQKYWGAHSTANLWDLPKFLTAFFEPTTWHEFRGSLLDRCAFLLALSAVPLMWRVGKDMLLWTYVLGVLPAMSGTFVSCTRFESIAFPVFIGLPVLFARVRSKRPLILAVAIFGALHTVLVWRFVNFRWAG